MSTSERYDVVIVGAGPIGLTLANLLGGLGVRTLVLERNLALEPEPRAVTLDDESLRTFQSAGLLDDVLKDVVQGYGVQYFGWRGTPLATILPTRQEYGFAKRNAFRQPVLVRTLLRGLARYDHVEVRFGCELTSFREDQAQVTCNLKNWADKSVSVAAQWVVACDGGRSTVRELCGVKLDGNTFAERWLIVDLAERTLPLRHTRTYCDPRRPAIRLPGPDGSVRYEFMLHHDDRDEQVLDEATFRQWIAARIPEDAQLPLVRKAIYGFHARVASQWKVGRVLLAGDAAHLTPPFAGQGLNSGIRDATNLAWKLAAVVQQRAPSSLLDTYEQERRPHATALIRMALRIGAFMQPKSLLRAALAQTALRVACWVPACRDYILQLKFKPKPRFSAGHFEPSPSNPCAELIPQPLVQVQGQGTLVRLDDVLGNDHAVIGFDTPAFRAAGASAAPPGAGCQVLAVVRSDDDFLTREPPDGVVLVRDIGGELAHFLDQHGATAVVLRPDRYTYRFLSESDLRDSTTASPPTVATAPKPSTEAALAAG